MTIAAVPSAPALQVPDDCTSEPASRPAATAFKGIGAYTDTIAGVKAALVDVLADWNLTLEKYVEPLSKKEQTCRAGLKAQGE